MFKITRTIQFCYGHRLMGYAGKCRHFHGHNGRVEVEVSASGLDPRGMVMDFGEIKKSLQVWVDENLDHRMLLRKDDPLLETLKKAGEPVYLMNENPTAENIACEIFQAARRLNLPVQRVTLWETDSSSATYSE